MHNSLKPKKEFGQNFLQNKSVAIDIVNQLDIKKNDIIIEIGPGEGMLTKRFFTYQNIKMIAIDIDQEVCDFIQNKFSIHNKYFTVLKIDAMLLNIQNTLKELDFEKQKVKIVSNLPYNISTLILINLLSQINNIDTMVLMFQKEVAERIISNNNNKNYGRLSLMTQLLCKIDKVFDIAPEFFYPKPKVTSTVLKFTPLEKSILDLSLFTEFEKFCKLIFSIKRKKMKNVLLQKFNLIEIEKIFQLLNIDIGVRAEQLSKEQIYEIFLEFSQLTE